MQLEDVRRLYEAAASQVPTSKDVDVVLWFMAASVVCGFYGVESLKRADFNDPLLRGYTLEGTEQIVEAERFLAEGFIEAMRSARFPGVARAA